MRGIFIGCLIFLSACNGVEEKSSISDLSYTLTPIFSDVENRLNVEVAFTGDMDGETTIRVGARWKRDENAGKRFRNLSVSGQNAIFPTEINQPLLSISHAPGAELKLTYTLSSEDMDDAMQTIEYFYVPVLQRDVFHLIGSTSLIVPRWDDEEAIFNIDVKWANLPEGWSHVDTLPDRPVRPQEIGSQILAITPSDSISVVGDTYKLTVLKAGEHDFDRGTFQAEMAKIYEGLNTLWQADDPKFLVTLLGAPDYASYSSFTGTGRFNSFASAASKDIDFEFLSQFLAHEVAHHWMPNQLGIWPGCQDGETCPPRISWFSEGFTDFVMTRAMLSEGRWTQDDLLAYTNLYLRNYYMSPAKTAKAQKIDELFWEDYEHEKQPYWRGFLLAMNWDKEIRQHSGETSSAMDVLQAMYETAKTAQENNQPELTSEYIAQNFSSNTGRDLFKDVEKYYYMGEVLKPHPEMFAGCATLNIVPVSTYDVGFDVESTFSSGVISGVVLDHNAAKAGLRDGQAFVNKVSGGGGDTTIPLVLTVNDNAKPITISYLPISGDYVQVPQFEKTNSCNTE